MRRPLWGSLFSTPIMPPWPVSRISGYLSREGRLSGSWATQCKGQFFGQAQLLGSQGANGILNATLCTMQRGYDEEWLGGTFSQAVFVGNGLMAILSGFLAHTLVEGLALGPVAPFDAAHAVLLLGGVVVVATWTENFGDESREQKQLSGESDWSCSASHTKR